MYSEFEINVLLPLQQSLNNREDKNAFFIGGEYYTYGDLNRKVSTIRAALRENNCQPGQRVALAVDDNIDTYASIIALWMEGCAYIPMHPLHPVTRNMEIIGQTEPALLLHTEKGNILAESAKKQGYCTLCTPLLQCSHEIYDSSTPTDDSHLAYILFTSGSTGSPKGVCITRGNLAAFIESFWLSGVVIEPGDRCLQAFDLTFDVSIQAFVTALLHGACSYTIPYGQVKYLYAAQLMIEQHLTHAAMAPSMLTYLRPWFDQLKPDSLKTTILTAEATPVELAEEWFSCAPNTDIYDFYGPTEGTVYCTCYRLNREGKNLSAIGMTAIGKPLANVTALLVDEEGKHVTDGEKGELCIAGKQVTPGYWNNEQRNTSAFFTRREGDTDVRYYRTGDLCQFTSDGNLLYFGRLDHQTKIQGFRVELGEIEYHARNYSHCRTVATSYSNNLGLTEIALFIESTDTDTTELTHYLSGHLPHYMVPSQIICIPEFPLNKSEKIDRPALAKRLKQELSSKN